jgi:hypothetical protein
MSAATISQAVAVDQTRTAGQARAVDQPQAGAQGLPAAQGFPAAQADAPPDARPLRRLPVPVSQPRPALRVVREEERPTAWATLPLPLAVDPGPAGHPRPPVDRQDLEAEDDFERRRPTPGNALPDPARWAAQFVQAAVEVTTGLRPASQLLRWTTDEVRQRLARRADLARRTTPRGRPAQRGIVCSTRVCIPRDGVAEASAVVSDGNRLRAVALRLEGLDGRWRVTALELG